MGCLQTAEILPGIVNKQPGIAGNRRNQAAAQRQGFLVIIYLITAPEEKLLIVSVLSPQVALLDIVVGMSQIGANGDQRFRPEHEVIGHPDFKNHRQIIGRGFQLGADQIVIADIGGDFILRWIIANIQVGPGEFHFRSHIADAHTQPQ